MESEVSQKDCKGNISSLHQAMKQKTGDASGREAALPARIKRAKEKKWMT